MRIPGWLKQRIVVGQIKGSREDAMKGKAGDFGKWLWRVLDGNKTQVFGLLLALKESYPGIIWLGYLLAGAQAAWPGVTPPEGYDSTKWVFVIGLVGSILHHAWKWLKERRAGLPATLASASVLDVPVVVLEAIIEKKAPAVVTAIAEGQAPAVVAAIEAHPDAVPPVVTPALPNPLPLEEKK